MKQKIYFYPQSYLRDRQLDVIRNWATSLVINPELAYGRTGAQVSKKEAITKKKLRSWKRIIPLINIKLRPTNLQSDTTVYIWGGIIIGGSFIVEIDNPYSLTGYNLHAVNVWRWLIRLFLLSSQCLEIRCMSNACRENMRVEFGNEVYAKAKVWYPSIGIKSQNVDRSGRKKCRFLFVSTQFDIKGGGALINAFRRLALRNANVHLEMVTYVDDAVRKILQQLGSVTLHDSGMTREELMTTFYPNSDVLVHPTYVDSFGLVVMEAVASGLPIIATDVYAINEMVKDGVNGFLLDPPLSMWNKHVPSEYFYESPNIKKHLRNVDTSKFENELEEAMERLASSTSLRAEMSAASIALFQTKLKVKSLVAD